MQKVERGRNRLNKLLVFGNPWLLLTLTCGELLEILVPINIPGENKTFFGRDERDNEAKLKPPKKNTMNNNIVKINGNQLEEGVALV